MTNNWAKPTELYNQGIKVQVTNKDIKKEDRLCMKSPPQIYSVQRVIFKFKALISGVNFSNNISITQIRVNMTEIKHDKTFES